MRNARRGPLSFGLIRSLVLLAVSALCIWIVATHGIRGVAIVAAIAVLTAIPQTRGYRVGERWLVRITGSRQRALVLVVCLAIALLVTVNVVQIVG